MQFGPWCSVPRLSRQCSQDHRQLNAFTGIRIRFHLSQQFGSLIGELALLRIEIRRYLIELAQGSLVVALLDLPNTAGATSMCSAGAVRFASGRNPISFHLCGLGIASRLVGTNFLL
jgi:hypothetical protein